MSNRIIKVDRTLRLAKQLTRDISDRKLQPGDSYYTTMEAAEFLGVAGAVANRVLQLLEKRGVLARRQKMGSVIVNPSEEPPLIDNIHFVLEQRFSAMGDYGDGIIAGIQDVLPQSHISYAVLESRKEVEMVDELLRQAGKNGTKHAFIMLSSPPAVQKRIAGSGFPCVLLGTKCSGVPRISQLDSCKESSLRLLVDYLHSQRRRRIALLLRRRVLPGDITLVNEAIRLGVPNCFFLQHMEDDPDCVGELCELIQTQFEPDGVVCLSVGQAVAFQEALDRLGKSPRETEITVVYYPDPKNSPRFTHTAPQLPALMQGRRLGHLLLDSAMGFKPKKEAVPMKLVLRDADVLPSHDSYLPPFVSRPPLSKRSAKKS